MLLSLRSPGSTAGLYDMCNLNFRQTRERNALMCAFLHWILAVCNVYWIWTVCRPYLFSQHWHRPYGWESVLLAAFSCWPWPAARVLSTALVALLWPALYDREHVSPFILEVRSPRSMYICHEKRHVNTYMQHLPEYPGNKWESKSDWEAGAEVDSFSFHHTLVARVSRQSEHTGVDVVCTLVSVMTVNSQFCLLSTPRPDQTLLEWRCPLLCTSCASVTYVYMCVGRLVCSPTCVTFVTAYHMLIMWTTGLSGLRRFNHGSVVPLSLMLLGFCLCFIFLKKANLCTKLLPGNFWFPEVHWGYLGEWIHLQWLLHSTVVSQYHHVVVSLRGKRVSIPQWKRRGDWLVL